MYLSIIIVGSLSVIGLFKTLTEVIKARDDCENAVDFLNDFRRYCDGLWNGNPDRALYEKLMMNADSTQSKMGYFGYASQWSPPFSNFMYRNYPLIINLIPQITQTATGSWFGLNSIVREQVHNYMTTVDDALLRYIGYLEKKWATARKNCFNPVIWLRDGVRLIIQLPFLVLMWFGILSGRWYHKIVESFVMKSIGFVVAMTELLSSITTIITGYDPSLSIIKKWLGM
jgi:hypothetical protein